MKIKYGILLSILFSTLQICAQTGYGSGYTNPQVIRNSDTLFYYVNNPDSNNATFTWTITGGIIAGHTSPFTAAGANSIGVIWDDANKQTVNNGTLTVSKAIDYGYVTLFWSGTNGEYRVVGASKGNSYNTRLPALCWRGIGY